VELHGKDATASKLVAIAEQLSEQVRREKEALQEASSATKIRSAQKPASPFRRTTKALFKKALGVSFQVQRRGRLGR
jgi:hypothetical protein